MIHPIRWLRVLRESNRREKADTRRVGESLIPFAHSQWNKAFYERVQRERGNN